MTSTVIHRKMASAGIIITKAIEYQSYNRYRISLAHRKTFERLSRLKFVILATYFFVI